MKYVSGTPYEIFDLDVIRPPLTTDTTIPGNFFPNHAQVPTDFVSSNTLPPSSRSKKTPIKMNASPLVRGPETGNRKHREPRLLLPHARYYDDHHALELLWIVSHLYPRVLRGGVPRVATRYHQVPIMRTNTLPDGGAILGKRGKFGSGWEKYIISCFHSCVLRKRPPVTPQMTNYIETHRCKMQHADTPPLPQHAYDGVIARFSLRLYSIASGKL